MKRLLHFKELDYVIRYPQRFTETEKYPLVLYLHGAGGRGRDTNLIYNHPFFCETQEQNLPAVFCAPQCYEDSWFSIFEQLQEFVRYVIDLDYIDAKRVYLLGASMGGYTAGQLAMSRPELFAAIVPICGGGMYWNGSRLTNMGVWAFHGSEDPIVFPEESQKMVDAVNRCGGNARLTIYEGVSHNAWSPTFANQEMWKWLFTQKNAYAAHKSEYDDVEEFG